MGFSLAAVAWTAGESFDDGAGMTPATGALVGVER